MNSGDLTKCSTVTKINTEMSSPEMSTPGTSSPGTSSPGIASPGMFSPGLSSRGISSPGGESIYKDKNAKDKKSDESKPVQIKSTQFFPDETNARSSLGLPRIPSSESELWSGTPPLSGHQSESPKLETKIPEKTSPIGEASKKLSRKESYKAQRKNYRQEKKRVANEVQTTLKDSSIALLEDWLKIRGTLKSWTKLWCIVKPGLLLLYKSSKAKSNHWVGTILLNSCQVIERPSKKDGFCFKIFHALDQSIWAPRGPENETIGAVVQPLPTSYLIFRAPSQAAGRCWMESLEIAIRSTTILRRSTSTKSTCGSANHETQWSEADYEKHFEGQELDVMQTSYMTEEISDSESEVSVKDEIVDEKVFETPYIPCIEEEDSLGKFGEQTEELPEEQKSLLWFLMKQVRPGMDLSRVVLPTFILEPRSFLDKLSDCYYHADILSRAVQEDDPFTRMKTIIQWYLSGLYKKPKGLKKPYNPILGETFRCFWAHPNGSKTFYIAEQVSHHPPVSAFYATNRQDGYSVSCSILARSKYWGNSTSAMLDGVAVLTLLPRGEDYTLTVPYAHCRGILIGTLTMELGGKISIECEKTGYKTELDFKLKPFLGGSSDVNSISGKLKLNEQTLALISGYWDGAVTITDRRTKEVQILWNPTPEIREKRLTRYVVPVEHQDEFESERLWKKVSEAIHADDLVAATEEKTVLEESQRTAAKERRLKNKKWVPKYFDQDPVTGSWVYRSADLRPWDPRNDLFQFEHEFIIQTKTKHVTPIVRASSIVSVDPANVRPQSPVVIIKARQKLNKKSKSLSSEASAEEFRSDSSASEHTKIQRTSTNTKILEGIMRVQSAIQDQKSAFNDLKVRVECLSLAQEDFFANQNYKINYKDAIFTMLGVLLAAIVLKMLFF